MTFSVAIFLLASLSVVSGQTNLFINAGFEEEASWWSNNNWGCSRSTCSYSRADPYAGNFSILVEDRVKSYAGPQQKLSFIPTTGTRYQVSARVKVNEDADAALKFILQLAVKLENGTTFWSNIVYSLPLRRKDSWAKMEGEFVMPDYQAPVTEVKILLRTTESSSSCPCTSFMADEMVLQEITLDVDWRAKAEARIREHRLGNITIVIEGRSSTQLGPGATLHLEQRESEFGFGSVVDGFEFNYNSLYREKFEELFEWGRLAKAMNWRENEYSANLLTWEASDMAMTALEEKGIRMRGGPVHNSGVSMMPDFVQILKSPTDVRRRSLKRLDDLIGRYRYRCQHWDVVKDMLDSNNFLVDTYGSDDIHTELYQRAQDVDYAAELFVNEKNVLSSSGNTQNVVTYVELLKGRGAPVGGIAADAKLNSEEIFDPALFLHRLDKLEEAGVPVWITGYEFSHTDAALRGQVLQDAFVAAFSHPAVKGMMLSGFWGDYGISADAAFYEGNHRGVTTNDATSVLEGIVEDYIKADLEVQTFDITPNSEIVIPDIQVYHGLYDVVVRDSQGEEWKRVERVPILKHLGPVEQEIRV